MRAYPYPLCIPVYAPPPFPYLPTQLLDYLCLLYVFHVTFLPFHLYAVNREKTFIEIILRQRHLVGRARQLGGPTRVAYYWLCLDRPPWLALDSSPSKQEASMSSENGNGVGLTPTDEGSFNWRQVPATWDFCSVVLGRIKTETVMSMNILEHRLLHLLLFMALKQLEDHPHQPRPWCSPSYRWLRERLGGWSKAAISNAL